MSNMVVRTNVLALNSHRNLGNVGSQQARASARLSSGFRINSAADDAAGLGISENMRAQIRGLDQASRNASDGISLIQTAEGGLSTISEMIVRIRELTVQASNDINTAEGGPGIGTNQSNRARIQGEINHLIDEIQRTADTLQFNGMTLLDGSFSGVSIPGMAEELSAAVSAFLALDGTGAAPLDINVAGAVTALENAQADLVNQTAARDAAQAAINQLGALQSSILARLGGSITAATGALDLATLGGITPYLSNLLGNLSTEWNEAVNAPGSTLTNDHGSRMTFVTEAINDHFGLTGANRLTDIVLFGANQVGTAHANSFAAYDIANWHFHGDGGALSTTGGGALHGAIARQANETINGVTAAATAGPPPVAAVIGPITIAGAGVAAFNAIGNAGNGLIETQTDFRNDSQTNMGLASAEINAELNQLNIWLAAHELGGTFDSFEAMMEAFNQEAQEGGALWLQVGANSSQGIFVEMPDIINDVANTLRTLFDSPAFGQVGNDSSTGSVAEGSGTSISALLSYVDEIYSVATAARGALGAIENRLEFTIQNLDVSSENLSAANSRIRDADMALEMMRLTQANVLQQAATAMLAQGNQAPQSILQLLG